ncbi:hypothetical protein AB1Y20_023254 [Prymnesium parvum]|uniref:Uncharacterized protein n=1 Tax=Prymnesium parvum TaxID=97485 RepID=A0AB34JE08_PRYPA
MDSDALAGCKNCARFTPVPYVHSFSASLEQCKNQTWHTENAGWIVTPTSSELGTEAVANSSFCSGECLYSFLFSNELLSNKCADAALHFFKRVDAQRHPPRTGPNDGVDLRSSSPTEPELQDGPGDIFTTPNASFHSHGTGQAVTAVL